ncbi:hypothetical protein LUZ60_007310 [Juncus effusus]|nr:hypothetical protein LUZ60_007310 [Juncus effusus]
MAVASIRFKSSSFSKILGSQLQNGRVQPSLFCLRREAHESSHNPDNHDITKADMKQANEALNSKNIEEHDTNKQTVASVLPEEAIEQTENFWAPDPETGVFVPAEETEGDSNGNSNVNCSNPAVPHHPTGNGPSVLDQTVFVREEEMEEVQIDEPMDQETQE